MPSRVTGKELIAANLRGQDYFRTQTRPVVHEIRAPQAWSDRRYLLDSTKIKTELGWSPSEDTDALLEETILWYRDNRSWWLPLIDKLRIDEEEWAAAKIASADNMGGRG